MPPEPSAARQGEERRAELVRLAIDVFGESGYSGGRIDEIARRAGIRRSSVLYHFADKPSLYAASIACVVRDITDRVLETQDGPDERLEAIADIWIDFVIDRPNAARLLLRQLIDAQPLPVHESEDLVRELLGSIQAAIDERMGPIGTKAIDASEFSLILSSTSLVWVAGRSAVAGPLGLDTLSPKAIQRHRRTLHALICQLLIAATEASEPTDHSIDSPDRELSRSLPDRPVPIQQPQSAKRPK